MDVVQPVVKKYSHASGGESNVDELLAIAANGLKEQLVGECKAILALHRVELVLSVLSLALIAIAVALVLVESGIYGVYTGIGGFAGGVARIFVYERLKSAKESESKANRELLALYAIGTILENLEQDPDAKVRNDNYGKIVERLLT